MPGQEYVGPKIMFQTNNHAVQEEFKGRWVLKEGYIEVPDYAFDSIDINELKTEILGGAWRSDREKHLSTRLLVNIGRENILKYFKAQNRGTFDRVDDFSYVSALRLLRIGDQAPKDFVIGYENEIGEAKEEIIDALKELVIEEKRLEKATDYNQFRGDKELWDEVAFKLNAPHEELRETRGNIKRRLEVAVELGMHQEELVLEGERPGERLDVPFYISSMCKTYRVPYSDSV